MDILEIAVEVGKKFPTERMEQFARNPLAILIRKHWAASFRTALVESECKNITASSSPGQGQWNAAPFIAFLHSDVTTSPRRGYYPVILYERGFKSFCLVMAQGADLLRSTFGAKEALKVLTTRAPELRIAAGAFQSMGFDSGPFATFSSGDSESSSRDADPWAASIAFGKRYDVDSPPTSEEFIDDLRNIIALYQTIVLKVGNKFEIQDNLAKSLMETGELPTNPNSPMSGHDGAMKIAQHKLVEYRNRNSKLVKQVKAELGYACQGCGVQLSLAYGKIGKDFIEAHHLVPLHSTPREGVELSSEDFAVLCPTCHRMIHRLGCPPVTVLQREIHSDLLQFHRRVLVTKE